MRICCLLLLTICFPLVSQGAFLIGLASPLIPEEGGGEGTHLFRLNLDGSGFADLGAIQLGGVEAEFDALAVSGGGQLLAFQIMPAGSRLSAIDLQQGTAAWLSPPLFGREIRGATFDGNNNLWAIDAAANELLNVSMSTGEELASVAITLNSAPFDIPNESDIAVDFSGQLLLTAGNQIFSLNSQSGELTLLLTDNMGEANPALVGAVVGMAPNERVVALASQGAMAADIVTYDLANPTARMTLLAAPFAFDVVLGDLALVHESVSSGDYNGDGVVDAADYVVWRNSLGSTTNLAANGNDFGTSMNRIDAADYLVWKNQYGVDPLAGLFASGQQIPEVPGSLVGATLVALILASRLFVETRRHRDTETLGC